MNVRCQKFCTAFLWSAAVIVFVTAALKVITALGDATILARRDPLFWFLTNRQVLVLASVLELFVIGILSSKRANRFWKIAAVAWLATSFVGYRVHLWSIGFQGGCNCAGSLGEWLNISSKTMNQLMRFQLAFLFIGSYAFLALELKVGFRPKGRSNRERQQDEREPSKESEFHSDSPTTSLIYRWKSTIFLVGTGISFLNHVLCSLACVFGIIVTPRDVYAAKPLAFEVHGLVQERRPSGEMPWAPKGTSYSFTFTLIEGKWRIHLESDSQYEGKAIKVGNNTVIVKTPDSQVLASDGTNFYSTSASQYPLADRKTQDQASARIGPGTIPFGVSDPLLVLWYCFGSSEYLESRDTSEVMPLHSVTFDDAASSNYLVSARWEMLPDMPRLPYSIQTSNYFGLSRPPGDFQKGSFAHTNVNFQVIGVTNFIGLTLPTSVLVDYYFPRRHGDKIEAVHSKHIEVIVSEVSIPNVAPKFRPPLAGRAVVADMRPWLSNPPTSLTVVASNGWPDDSMFSAKYSAFARHKSQQRRPLLPAVALGLAIVVPITFFFFKRLKKI
jgi:hypothetical protein